MNSGDISPEEAFHNTFFYFIEGLNVMALSAIGQRESVGGEHVAWELQNDVQDFGEAVLRCADDFLTQDERVEISELQEKLKMLPSEALGSEPAALAHPDWEVLRTHARHLLSRLERAIEENRKFLDK